MTNTTSSNTHSTTCRTSLDDITGYRLVVIGDTSSVIARFNGATSYSRAIAKQDEVNRAEGQLVARIVTEYACGCDSLTMGRQVHRATQAPFTTATSLHRVRTTTTLGWAIIDVAGERVHNYAETEDSARLGAKRATATHGRAFVVTHVSERDGHRLVEWVA